MIPFKKVKGVEIPCRMSYSLGMSLAMQGQLSVMSSLLRYKKWKIKKVYANKVKFNSVKDEFYDFEALAAEIIEIIYPD